MSREPFPRWVAIGILLLLGVVFATNHIAARVAFDHGTGLVTAVLVRSSVTALALVGVVLWMKTPIRLSAHGVSPWWVACLGGLIAIQSLQLYSAVARIPVGLALLVFNLFPAFFALLSWRLGGARPSAKMLALMLLILSGLALALNLPVQLGSASLESSTFWTGVGFGVGAAAVFSLALWVTEHKLMSLTGPVRSLWTMAWVTVILCALAAGVIGGAAGADASRWLARGLQWPNDIPGWLGLVGLTLCYGSAFSILFALMPRLDMARNAPASNIEPIAALGLGWLLLGQAISWVQGLGAAIVLIGIVLLALTGRRV